MADLFASLILRSSGQVPLVRPRIAPMFAPPSWTDEAPGAEFGEADAPLAGPRGVSHRHVTAEAEAAVPAREPAIAAETVSAPDRRDPGPIAEQHTVATPPRSLAPVPEARAARTAGAPRPPEDQHQPEAFSDQEVASPEVRERRNSADLSAPAPSQGQEMLRPPGQPVVLAQAPAFTSRLEGAAGEGSEPPSGPLRVTAPARSKPPPAPGHLALEDERSHARMPPAATQGRGVPAATAPQLAPVARGGPWPAAPAKVRGPAAEGPGASAVNTRIPGGDVIAPQPALSRPSPQGRVNVALPVARDAAPVSTPLAGTAQRDANGAPDALPPADRHAPPASLMPVLPAEANARDGEWVQPAARGQLAAERQRLSPVETSAPVVHVTIGRVEVRMVGAQATPATRQRPTRAAPQVTLEEYLRRRDGAGS